MRRRIGLALSGGGFRAVAFGLGALRALHDHDLLDRVSVISGVSGGSLLAALYAYWPGEFSGFEQQTNRILDSGLQLAIARHGLRPDVFAPALASSLSATVTGDGTLFAGRTRTDSLRHLLSRRAFGDRTLSDVRRADLTVVLNATDLRTGTAFRFGSRTVASSPHGEVVEPISVAEAVAASCAFPALLPAVERRYTFRKDGGGQHLKTVALSDGGIYDNLGLSVLQPGRSPQHTAHVYELDYLIVVDAGTGRPRDSTARLLGPRLKRAADIIHIRAQDAGRAWLHNAAGAGTIAGFIHAYLGMRDRNLPIPVPDLVPRENVASTRTNFRAMPAELRDLVARRGEQLTSALLDHYQPELG
jgi:NTE family protein